MKSFISSLIILLNLSIYAQTKTDTLTQNLNFIERKVESNESKVNKLKDRLLVIEIQMEEKKNEKKTFLDQVASNWIPILSFLLALSTIYFGRKAIQQNRNTKLYEIVVNVTTEYASEEMLQSILMLIKWRDDCRANEVDFGDEFGRIRKANYAQIKDLDVARRKVSHFFSRIYLLHKNNVVNQNDIMGFITAGQIEILLDINEKLEEAINKDYSKELFDFFRLIKNKLESTNS